MGGKILDAKINVIGGSLVLNSRGGAMGKHDVNADYSTALRLILNRLVETSTPIRGAWVDSASAQKLPLDEREILGAGDIGATPSEIFTRLTSRMRAVGRDASSKSSHGNSNKRIRLYLGETLQPAELIQILGLTTMVVSEGRLPVSELRKVSAVHLWQAIEMLNSGYKDHEFDESDAYDVLLSDGTRLPPKAMFGVAATLALSFPVLPKHFSGGLNTPCFQILEEAGYVIVEKGASFQVAEDAGGAKDREWLEGTPAIAFPLT